MNNTTLYKTTVITLNLISVLLLIVPYSIEFMPDLFETSEDGWGNVYVFDDMFLIIQFSPFYISWILFQFMENTSIKNLSKIVMILLSGFYLFIGFLGFSMPIQDFIPSYGALLPFTFLLVFLIILVCK